MPFTKTLNRNFRVSEVEIEEPEMLYCDDCGGGFQSLTTHKDKMLGEMEVCDECLRNIKETENVNN